MAKKNNSIALKSVHLVRWTLDQAQWYSSAFMLANSFGFGQTISGMCSDLISKVPSEMKSNCGQYTPETIKNFKWEALKTNPGDLKALGISAKDLYSNVNSNISAVFSKSINSQVVSQHGFEVLGDAIGSSMLEPVKTFADTSMEFLKNAANTGVLGLAEYYTTGGHLSLSVPIAIIADGELTPKTIALPLLGMHLTDKCLAWAEDYLTPQTHPELDA
jgi:hypothetical protein